MKYKVGDIVKFTHSGNDYTSCITKVFKIDSTNVGFPYILEYYWDTKNKHRQHAKESELSPASKLDKALE